MLQLISALSARCGLAHCGAACAEPVYGLGGTIAACAVVKLTVESFPQARYAMCSTTDLEAAVADMKRACDLAPEERSLRQLSSQWTHELNLQNKRDSKMLSGAFSTGDLYTDEEAARCKISAHPGTSLMLTT